jgi:ABC-2 type transport system permease protein
MEIGLNIFFQFGLAATGIGVIIMTQDAIIAEKQIGLAEWLLSKPLVRRAYMLAKLTANAVPMLIWLIGLPAAVAYGLLSMRMGAAFPVLPFLSGVGVMTVHTLFYLTLTLMLGTIFNSRGPILGIALGSVLGGGMIGGFIKPLLTITPWMLPKVATLTASGQTLPLEVSIAPVTATFLWSVVFSAAALARFEKMEF